MNEPNTTDRRTFIRRGAMGAGALWALSLQDLMMQQLHAAPNIKSPYGPVTPTIDGTTGLPLLQLPEGFHYWSYGWTGDVMSDGVATPALHDGMAVVDVRGRSGEIVLVRNHEVATGIPYLDKPRITYANDGGGGNTNLIFDTQEGRWKRAWSTLAGTVRNCAGGVTAWGTWLSCEETDVAGHGWNFEVGAQRGNPNPLVEMGRFSHEALMVDPLSGYVYQTEDAGNCGLYRFVPNAYGRLDLGGELFMLKVKGRNNFDLGGGFRVGKTWDIRWVRIDDPWATMQSVYAQGEAKGGARFSRLEGAWWGDRTGFFLSTDGGSVGEGQVFELDPVAETLRLVYDSQTADTLDNPDNMTVTPRGGLLLCEDGGSAIFERLIGLTTHGRAFTFAINNVLLEQDYNDAIPAGDYRTSEWAGACYSPDGRWLFANIQAPGITFAITGPWGNGPL
jgi:uncharacterized protein